jgi:predicted nucleic acid-binding protein
MRWLLDTSVYSQPLKKSPNLPALRRWKRVGDQFCLTSIVVTAEVERGLISMASERLWSGYRKLLEDRLEVLDTDAKVWKRFSEMKARQRIIGRGTPVTRAWRNRDHSDCR